MPQRKNNPNAPFVAKPSAPKSDPRLEPMPGAEPPNYHNRAIIEVSPKQQLRAQKPGMDITKT